MSKRVLIATGGTGGHIYPAIALAQQLLKEFPDIRVLFVGGGLDDNKYFDRKAFNYRTVSCGTFFKKSPSAILASMAAISRGIWQSRQIIREFRPNVAVGFGSFYSFPPLVASKMLSVPYILHEANSIPGKVNRFLSPWARMTGVHFPETQRLLKGKICEVGMPLRQGFQKTEPCLAEAQSYFNLCPDTKTLLIFGGSQGAQAINVKVRDALIEYDVGVNLQILHIAGEPSMVQMLQKDYARKGIRACVKAFEERMDLAWRAADAVICRAGASTVAEQLEFEVPGILIPFTLAAENHQEHNADFMVATVGGGVKVQEKETIAGRLAVCLNELFKEDGALLQAMRRSMGNYKKKARTRDLCSFVKELL